MTNDETASPSEWVTPEQARDSVMRFNASHFSNKTNLGEKARYSIPANPERDDDLLLSRFIDQYTELAGEVREWLCLTCHEVYPGPPQAGVMCVVCPKCKGDCGPKGFQERRELESQLTALSRQLAEAEAALPALLTKLIPLWNTDSHTGTEKSAGSSADALAFVQGLVEGYERIRQNWFATAHQLAETQAALVKLVKQAHRYGPLENWECEHGFALNKCPNLTCEDARLLREVNEAVALLSASAPSGEPVDE